MDSVSVIIPTFNRREVLSRAIRSVLAQKPAPLELIVVDDGSTDGTPEFLQNEFPSVHLLCQKNQGPSAARNRGIEKARGTWLAFLDSDDEWLPGKLRVQLEFAAQNPACRIVQTEEIWIRNGKRVNPMKKHQKYNGWIYEKCLPLCIISPSAVMIHRELFENVGVFDESYPACEDYELWLRIASRWPVALISKPYITKYGGHRDQRSREFPAMDRFRIRALIKTLNAGILDENQTRLTQAMLLEKASIYFSGVEKRAVENEETRLLREAVETVQKNYCEISE